MYKFNEKVITMHFIDFLLHLIYIFCWGLKSIYAFSIDYIVPVIAYILPVLIKYLSHVFSFVLRIFFTYISPCIVQVLHGTTYVFTKLLNGISIASITIIDSNAKFDYLYAIIMGFSLIIIVYFRITQKIYHFFHESYEMTSLYLRFIMKILKMLLLCTSFIYRKASNALLCKREQPEDQSTRKIGFKKEKRHSNGANGTANGSFQLVN